MSIRKRGDRYQVRVRLGSGERIERTLPAGARLDDARRLEASIYRRRVEVTSGAPVVRLIDEAIEQWEPQAKRLKSWQKDLRYRLDVLREHTAGKTLEQLPDVAQKIKEDGLKAGLKPASVNRYLAILRRLANLVERWQWTDKPLAKRIELLPGEMQRHRYLTVEEVRALMAKCDDPEVRDLVLFASLTGLRRSEILSLRPEHIREHDIVLTSATKSGRPRIVPMPMQARRIAQERVPFTVGVSLLNKRFRAARKAAGMTDVRLHDLRHTFASWLAQGGASLTAIRDLLGHSSLAVTSRYAHLSRPDLARVTRRLKV